jgi:uncharacterized protein
MDRNDQQAIEALFDKLAAVERRSPQRDPEAERFIRDEIARQPGAPYYMAQTIVVQEQALNAAQERIEQLEREAAEPSSDGGLLSGILGNERGTSRPRGSVPRVGRAEAEMPRERYAPQREGGGFLAGAAQTAMGVAGGVLLGNMIADMFRSDPAEAAEAKTDNQANDAQGDQKDAQSGQDDGQAQEASFEDHGFDDGGFGDIDI